MISMLVRYVKHICDDLILTSTDILSNYKCILSMPTLNACLLGLMTARQYKTLFCQRRAGRINCRGNVALLLVSTSE